MSRSRKKTPIIGFTCARSDKPWKAKAARSFRQAARQALGQNNPEAPVPERRWAVVNPYSAPKDGKHWIGAGKRGGCGSDAPKFGGCCTCHRNPIGEPLNRY